MMRTPGQLQQIFNGFMACDPAAIDKVRSAIFERSPIIIVFAANFVTGMELAAKPLTELPRLATCVLQEVVADEGISFHVLRFEEDADGYTYFSFLYWDGTKRLEEPTEIGVVPVSLSEKGTLLMLNDEKWVNPDRKMELIPCKPIRQIRRRCQG